MIIIWLHHFLPSIDQIGFIFRVVVGITAWHEWCRPRFFSSSTIIIDPSLPDHFSACYDFSSHWLFDELL